MPRGNKNDTAPAGLNNAIKLTDLVIAWARLGFHMTDRRYRQIAKEGRFSEPVRGYVDALKCLIQISIYYQSMGEGRGDSTHEEEKKLLTKARRKQAEMELAEAEGRLIEVEQVTDDLSTLFANVKTSIRGWSKRLPAVLFGRTQKEIGREILSEADRILTDLADGIGTIAKKRGRG
jgi:hypothetical protein